MSFHFSYLFVFDRAAIGLSQRCGDFLAIEQSFESQLDIIYFLVFTFLASGIVIQSTVINQFPIGIDDENMRSGFSVIKSAYLTFRVH